MIRSESTFRIWSLLDFALSGSTNDAWDFMGCVSMEPRSVAAVLEARRISQVSNVLVLRLSDDPESRFFSAAEERTELNQETLQQEGIDDASFSSHKLLGPFGYIAQQVENFISSCTERNLIVDITSMPKKVFFYVLKRLIQSDNIFENILITYAEPDHYPDEGLAENPQPWNTLPGFDAPTLFPDKRRVVIGIGYDPLGLPDLVMKGEFPGAKTHLLFPFPSPPDRIKRNWEFAKDLFPNPSSELVFNHVDALNVPEVFDLLNRIGGRGEIQLTLAPYGPKSMSMAMALYASKYQGGSNSTAVYYTQPTGYNADYSTGVKTIGGRQYIHCYAIKRLGRSLY